MRAQPLFATLAVAAWATAAVGGGPDDSVYVCGWFSNNVQKFTTAGVFQQTILTAVDGLTNAHSVEFGPDGHLYVTSFGQDSILRFDGNTGTPLGPFVTPGSGGLNGPSNAIFGPDGDLYVTSLLNNRVLRYSGSDGAPLGSFVPNVTDPESLRFDDDGNLLVVSGAAAAVFKYDGSTGAFMTTVVSSGLGGLNDPHDLIIGPDGLLYVTSFGVHKVIRYTQDGLLVDVFVEDVVGTPEDESGGLLNAHGLAFGPDGHLYVASFGTDQVKRYDGTTGEYLDDFITGAGLNGPIAVRFAFKGDLNHDGVVDAVDFLMLLADWGDCGPPCLPTCLADVSGDCSVDTVDFLILLANWD